MHYLFILQFTPRFVSNFIGIIKNTHTSNILSPFLMPAFSAAPRSKTALTCCKGAYNSPLILLNCPPNDNKPRMNHQGMQFGTNKWLVCEKNWKICFEERKNVLYGFVYVLEQDEKKIRPTFTNLPSDIKSKACFSFMNCNHSRSTCFEGIFHFKCF